MVRAYSASRLKGNYLSWREIPRNQQSSYFARRWRTHQLTNLGNPVIESSWHLHIMPTSTRSHPRHKAAVSSLVTQELESLFFIRSWNYGRHGHKTQIPSIEFPGWFEWIAYSANVGTKSSKTQVVLVGKHKSQTLHHYYANAVGPWLEPGHFQSGGFHQTSIRDTICWNFTSDNSCELPASKGLFYRQVIRRRRTAIRI